ncbi:outer membrane efflux protein [Fibrisoma limi BUZ 3]|uniref:Outer membrane efflux protein n=1 Tax=Fibrisoma limi BUZ 3 TaxID=1185876 RepID=I2GRI4_9BACT|nr:TolC family protein [Fibrisoma limi]CCH56512.1 outer membrane efflux protein [Fibrisoma limi BUZ 3]
MKSSQRFLFAVLYLSGTLTQAQDLTLDQLINKALSSNFDVQAARLDEQRTEAQIAEVRAGARPRVNVSGDYRRYLKIPGQVIPASLFGGPEGSYAVAAFGLPYNLSTTAQVTQPLYNQSLTIGLKAAKVSRDLTALQTQKTKEDVAYDVAATYYNLQTTAQQIAFLRSNLASTERLIRITDLLRQNQLAKGVDVDRLQISKTSAQAQIESAQATYNQLLNALKLLTGTPQADSLQIRTTIEETTPVAPGNEFVINRTDLQLLDHQKELNSLEQRNIKAGFFPTVSAYGTANSSVYAIGGDNSYIKNIPGYWFGLQLNWSVFDGLERKAKLGQKRIDDQKLDIQLRQLREAVAMDIANARNQFLVEQQNIATNRGQVTLAEKVYAQTQLQFKEGTVDITDVVQAENSLREAQNNYLTTLVKLRTAELDWKKATGSLISR